jgi:outer membrane protein TolC
VDVARHPARTRTIASCLALAALVLSAGVARADEDTLPSPLDAPTVARLARARRAEVQAARLRAVAAAERPKIVSALPDPMVMVAMDHLPFNLMGVDGSITVQQDFPLSGVLGARGRAAQASVGRFRADAERAELDVALEALDAFYMVAARRATRAVLDEQITLVAQLAVVARAHLASGHGMQADVLRLDNERARLEVDRSALLAETRSAEAMLSASLARDPAALVPELAWADELTEPAPADVLARSALANRPELKAALAERARARAEIDAMNAMYNPMAFVRIGPSYSMLEGAGAMAMIGVSIPVWREKLGAGVAEARAMESMAAADVAAMNRMVLGRVASARELVIAERTRLVALRSDILPRARLVVDSATQSFAASQSPMIAVLDATRDLREVRMQEIMVRAELGHAWAVLRRETGELR